jgi:two-component system, NarL family, sensor histidine kinase DegS
MLFFTPGADCTRLKYVDFPWVLMNEDKHIREKLERVNLVLCTLRNVDQLILEESNRKRLIKGVCRNLVATRGYYNAWILLLDNDGTYAMSVGAGLGASFLTLARKLKSEGPARCGRQALLQSGAVIVRDPVLACTDCPLSGAYGGRGGITTRLWYRGKLYGLLCASIPSNLVEEEEECTLFENIARDVAYALHKIDLEEEHEIAQKNLRLYAEQAIMAQEEERRRIALELHDETAQALASLGMDIGALAKNKKLSSAEISGSLKTLQTETESILEGVRSLSKALRPPMLEEFGLLAALKGLVNELADQQQIRVRFNVEGTPRRLSADAEITAYRVAQEALSNVKKHAAARACSLVLQYSLRKMVLEIRDDGRGFAFRKASGGTVYPGKLGLTGMQERAKLIGGKLNIKSRPGSGTIVRLELPTMGIGYQT